MTPFAQLGLLHKDANATNSVLIPAFRGYQAPHPGLGSELAWGAGELGADLALGSQAITGVPWFLGKSIYQAAKGNWGNAAGNLGMLGLSFLPGAASAAAAGKFGATGLRIGTGLARAGAAAKALPGAARVGQAVGAAKGAVSSVRGGKTAWNVASMGAKQAPIGIASGMLPNAPAPSAAPTPRPPLRTFPNGVRSMYGGGLGQTMADITAGPQ